MDQAGGYADYEFVAEFYDHVGPYRDRPDVDFYVATAVQSGGPVLELGCGTGRVLIPTARAGIRIVGLDLSSHMLQVCQERLAQEPEEVQARVDLVQGDLRDFQLDTTFALVTIPFRPFQHLTTVADQRACLGCVRRHLNPDGRLVLDVFNPWLEALVSDDLGQELGEEPAFTLADGRRVVRRHRTVDRDPCQQVNQVELIYYVTHPDGRTERLVHGFAMRYLFRYELEHLLARCGFDLEHVYADFQRRPYGSTYPGDLVAVARRAGRPPAGEGTTAGETERPSAPDAHRQVGGGPEAKAETTFVIETERLAVRAYRDADVADIVAYSTDADFWLARALDYEPTPEGVRAYWEPRRAVDPHGDPEWMPLIIELKTEGRAIGHTGIGVVKSGEHKRGTVGWLLGRRYQRQGLATEAARALITFGFEVMGLHRISARTGRDNVRSWRLMERLGMRREGHYRESHQVKGEWRDEFVYAVLAHEWTAASGTGSSAPHRGGSRPGGEEAEG